MAKPIKAVVKLTIPAGTATPAPPVATALGPHGINMGEFCTQFNTKTADKKGSLIPAVITIFEDRTFSFITKQPPISNMIKRALGIQKGASEVGKEKIGKLSMAQLNQIATAKMPDLNTADLKAAKKIVAGTARSMGIQTEL